MNKVILVLCFIVFWSPGHVTSLNAGEIVEVWAELLGQELWNLATNITNIAKIKDGYTSNNAQVEKKDPEKLLTAIVENVIKMLKRKMDAVRCIMKAAEDNAETYTYNATNTEFVYFSSKYSYAENIEDGRNYFVPLPESMLENKMIYLNMSLVPDTHFYNIEVDTSHSSVHVPTNIYDKSEDAQSAIEWSENLDDVFVQNYNSDPALSWQFFCASSSGVMRHYPAMHWQQETDLFDCRTRSWFIEASTCSKDVVILLDNSGSMTGMSSHIARFTVSNILDTFSNNDFINILSYSDVVVPLEPCFNGTLVQATLENIQIFKKRVQDLRTGSSANLKAAMTQAFQILINSRQSNECGEDGAGCNRAIMLVTDGIQNNVTEVFKEYNWLQNGTNIPVRVFTYLVGREAIKFENLIWMACLNRGYFVHIRSLDEVISKVFQYIPVIARPLVLQAEKHPVSWTHAFLIDSSFEVKSEGYEKYRLLMSAAVPAYDRKMNRNNITRMAELLGVASTDVPIDDIKKLTFPYKIGVNGYTFVVSNNGYLLMHPNLRPFDEDRLNKNYNSMDLTEVEFLDDNLGPREMNPRILQLREALVNHTEGSMLNMPVKQFYDKMRRVYKEVYNYYYAPLLTTPFSIGIALPQSHGDYWLKVGDEISKNKHLKININKSYFSGTNWKIHPDWVYCKYHYTEGHEFATPEEELIHFLNIINNEKNFTWPPNQYGEYDFTTEDLDDEEVECGGKTLSDDDYYCDEELMQHLIFDAKIMEEAFMPMELNYTLLEMYGATLKYVATMSGLTRWEYIYGEGNDTVRDFGDVHSRAIDETWYRSAVLQHKIDADSFVYSIPFEDIASGKQLSVIGSHAIFPRDAGAEAPGCVVGFQFDHSKLSDKFKEFIDNNLADVNYKHSCQECNKYLIDSFVIDNNGYVVLSETNEHVGRFFGEIEGSVMEAMLMNKTFENVTVYDLQSVCVRSKIVSSASNVILTPFYFISSIVEWIFSRSLYLLFELNLQQFWTDGWILANPLEELTTSEPVITTTTKAPRLSRRKGKKKKEEEDYFRELRERKPKIINISEPCDLQATLYILNQTKFAKRNEYFGEEKSDCSKPFFTKKIPHTNLLLVLVDASYPSCYTKLSTEKNEIFYKGLGACHKLELNRLPRRKLSGCYNEHPLEREITHCGGSNPIYFNMIVFIITIFICITN